LALASLRLGLAVNILFVLSGRSSAPPL